MEQSLFQLMLEWENQKFGFTSRNLHGQPLLKTDLDWLNQRSMIHFGLESSNSIRPHHLDPSFWKSFATHLYHTHRNGMKSIVETTLHFLEDIQDQHPSLSTWGFTSAGALRTQQNELDRLLKVHQLLQETHRPMQLQAHPTEPLGDSLFREGWEQLQKEELSYKIEDSFRLVSKHVHQNRAYLKAQSTNQSILLHFDPILLKILKEGDCLPMVLVGSDQRHLSIESCQYPLLEDE